MSGTQVNWERKNGGEKACPFFPHRLVLQVDQMDQHRFEDCHIGVEVLKRTLTVCATGGREVGKKRQTWRGKVPELSQTGK